MPMIDAYIPEGALTDEAETKLFDELTEILVTLEGFEPTNKLARAATWIFLHRPQVLSAAVPSRLPRYRFHLTVPEGQYTDEICEEIVKQVSAVVARAEGGPLTRSASALGSFRWKSMMAAGAAAAKCATCRTS